MRRESTPAPASCTGWAFRVQQDEWRKQFDAAFEESEGLSPFYSKDYANEALSLLMGLGYSLETGQKLLDKITADYHGARDPQQYEREGEPTSPSASSLFSDENPSIFDEWYSGMPLAGMFSKVFGEGKSHPGMARWMQIIHRGKGGEPAKNSWNGPGGRYTQYGDGSTGQPWASPVYNEDGSVYDPGYEIPYENLNFWEDSRFYNAALNLGGHVMDDVIGPAFHHGLGTLGFDLEQALGSSHASPTDYVIDKDNEGRIRYGRQLDWKGKPMKSDVMPTPEAFTARGFDLFQAGLSPLGDINQSHHFWSGKKSPHEYDFYNTQMGAQAGARRKRQPARSRYVAPGRVGGIGPP